MAALKKWEREQEITQRTCESPIHTRECTHTHTHGRTHTHTHAHRGMHAHTHTHARAHTQSVSCVMPSRGNPQIYQGLDLSGASKHLVSFERLLQQCNIHVPLPHFLLEQGERHDGFWAPDALHDDDKPDVHSPVLAWACIILPLCYNTQMKDEKVLSSCTQMISFVVQNCDTDSGGMIDQHLDDIRADFQLCDNSEDQQEHASFQVCMRSACYAREP
jgi:hypothetical protein